MGLFIRLQIYESPLFAKIRDRKQQAAVPFFEVLKRYPRNVLLAMGARMAENGGFYVFSVFVLTYATVNLKLPRTVTLNCLLIATVLQFLAIPTFGILSDTIGRHPVYLGGAVAMAAFAFPFFWMINTTSPFWICLAISIALIAQSAMYAPKRPFFPNCSGRMSGTRALRLVTSWPRRWPEAWPRSFA